MQSASFKTLNTIKSSEMEDEEDDEPFEEHHISDED